MSLILTADELNVLTLVYTLPDVFPFWSKLLSWEHAIVGRGLKTLKGEDGTTTPLCPPPLQWYLELQISPLGACMLEEQLYFDVELSSP